MQELTRKQEWLITIGLALTLFIHYAIFFTGMGSLFFYFGWRGLILLQKVKKNGIQGIGTIISYNIGSRGYKTPVIAFTTTTGEIIKQEPTVYGATGLSKIRTYKKMIGKQVPVLYLHKEPKRFIVSSEKKFSYFDVIQSMLFGAFFIGWGMSQLLDL